MGLIFWTQPLQYLDRFIDSRCIDLYRLEAAFQGSVFLDVFTVFVHRRSPDTLQLSTTQRGFDDIRRIHRALG